MLPANFQTGEVRLPGLRPITLEPGIYLSVGEARSLQRFYAQRIKAIMDWQERADWFDRMINWVAVQNMLLADEQKLPPEPGLGFCGVYRPRAGGIWGIIGWRRHLSLARGIFTAGHESGHFLQQINRKSILQAWVKEAGWDLDLADYNGEDLGHVAGLLALHYRYADLVAANDLKIWDRYYRRIVVEKQNPISDD